MISYEYSFYRWQESTMKRMNHEEGGTIHECRSSWESIACLNYPPTLNTPVSSMKLQICELALRRNEVIILDSFESTGVVQFLDHAKPLREGCL